MSKTAFYTFQQQVNRLYYANEYVQAFALIEEKYADFPEQSAQIAYWRLCFHALLGKQKEALQIFHETLDRGDWFGPSMLEQDLDLVELRPLAEFQEMLEVCRQRLVQAKDKAQPELHIVKPEAEVRPLPLLIALHGNQGNAYESLGEWRGVTAQGWLLSVPTSSQIDGPGCFIWNDREAGGREIYQHLTMLNGEHEVDSKRVVLGGFSMGGGLAVWVALTQAIPCCGFVVLAPYLTDEELEKLPAILAQQQPTGLRGYIIVGQEDSV
ncbi:alpha/beta hydrolase [Ktedonobacter racemifer]|uniref:alpha/beta hydrolase n=1 Tax=Ktedonobacter racemifer TaxID=363277 RepID=UPI00031369A8|nr:alpha/beta hydrolase [Ktedonobacter racemifer]